MTHPLYAQGHSTCFVPQGKKKKTIVFIGLYCLIWWESPPRLSNAYSQQVPREFRDQWRLVWLENILYKRWGWMSLREEGCTMSTSHGEKTSVYLGNNVEDSPLGRRTMTLCSRSDYWLALLRTGERKFSRKHQYRYSRWYVYYLCFVLFVCCNNHTSHY